MQTLDELYELRRKNRPYVPPEEPVAPPYEPPTETPEEEADRALREERQRRNEERAARREEGPGEGAPPQPSPYEPPNTAGGLSAAAGDFGGMARGERGRIPNLAQAINPETQPRRYDENPANEWGITWSDQGIKIANPWRSGGFGGMARGERGVMPTLGQAYNPGTLPVRLPPYVPPGVTIQGEPESRLPINTSQPPDERGTVPNTPTPQNPEPSKTSIEDDPALSDLISKNPTFGSLGITDPAQQKKAIELIQAELAKNKTPGVFNTIQNAIATGNTALLNQAIVTASTLAGLATVKNGKLVLNVDTTHGGDEWDDLNTLANKFASGAITQDEMARRAARLGISDKAILDKVSIIRGGGGGEGGGGYSVPGAPGAPGSGVVDLSTEVVPEPSYSTALDTVMNAMGYQRLGTMRYNGNRVPVTSVVLNQNVSDPQIRAWIRNLMIKQGLWQETPTPPEPYPVPRGTPPGNSLGV